MNHVQCPEIVDKCLQCGKDIDYYVVHLLATLDLNDVATDVNHGQMTVNIHYKTPYTVTGKGFFVLFCALGNDVSLHSVLSLPTLLAMSAVIDLVKGLFSCIELNRSVPLDLQPPGKGLPEGDTLNNYLRTISPIVSTNITSNNSILHYTLGEGIPHPLCLSTPSDNIIVTHQFFQDTTKRELTYVPSCYVVASS